MPAGQQQKCLNFFVGHMLDCGSGDTSPGALTCVDQFRPKVWSHIRMFFLLEQERVCPLQVAGRCENVTNCDPVALDCNEDACDAGVPSAQGSWWTPVASEVERHAKVQPLIDNEYGAKTISILVLCRIA